MGRWASSPASWPGRPVGLAFIYQSLELVAARYGLRDLAVVVTARTAGLFRLGRAPLELAREPLPSYLAAAFGGRPGLYAEPPVVGPLAAACLTSLVELALSLDLLRHDASHDALTGLLNRRSYELLLDQARKPCPPLWVALRPCGAGPGRFQGCERPVRARRR